MIMLSKFSVQNFYSINEQVTLNFNFSNSKAHAFKQNVIFQYNGPTKRSILNGGIIFGANASGKTNLLEALKFLKAHIDNSYKFDEKEDIMLELKPFKFAKDNSTRFKIEFILENVEGYHNDDLYTNMKHNSNIKKNYIINYELFLNNKDLSVQYENLRYSEIMKTKVGKEKILFERKHDEVTDNASEINEIRKKVEKDNITFKSLLSLVINDVNKNYFKEEIETFEYKLMSEIHDKCFKNIHFNQRNASDEFMQEINKNKDYRKYVLRNLKKFDFAIKDIEVEDITADLLESVNNSDTPEKIKEMLIESIKSEKRYTTYALHFVNEQKYRMPLSEESRGTQKFLNHSYSMYEALLEDGLFVVDEFESAYHHRIQEGIVNNFINQSGKAQFLIVSHNSLLLNKNLFSKEQIIFLEKDREKESTVLKHLSEYKDVTYNNHNWLNLYYQGRLGAVPEVVF
ncbi:MULTISPECIES: AAA family ATPase [Staphylococcus]|uniref:AAA family ATPase n=1 Tax=Staphylococcus TaxID=1279 RepID=UPI0009F1E5ED|nr:MULTISPECIES: ATP-binding protein [Staphylococcus]